MADVAVKGTVPGSAPLVYTLADAAEFVPKSIVAKFDGTSATSAFYPTLVLTDASGLEVGRIPTSVSVAAGGSAEVSWFPGGLTSSATSGATLYLWGVYSSQSIPGDGNYYRIEWNHLQTNDLSVFGTDTSPTAVPPYNNSAGDKYVFFSGIGSYIAGSSVYIDDVVGELQADIGNDGSQFVMDWTGSTSTVEELFASNAAAFDDTQGLVPVPMSRRMFYVDSTTGAGVCSLEIEQNSGTSSGVIACNFGLIYGDGGSGDMVTVY